MSKFELHLEDNLFRLHENLSNDWWKPDPYTIFYVQDPKLRKIHKASVRDRVLFQAVYQSLYQIFDSSFIHDSYSSRNLKGTHRGVARFEVFARKVAGNYCRKGWVQKCDIQRFFDSIDHRILLELISNKVSDTKLHDLVRQIVFSFETAPGKGLPLGNVTSQLFANVYLNKLDQFIKHAIKAKYYIRYSDDFVILHESKEYLEESLVSIKTFCNEKLLLDLHPKKISLRKIHQGSDFLGYVILPGSIVLRTCTKRRVFWGIEKMKNSMENQEEEQEKNTSLQRVISSYLGLLSHCKGEKIKSQIERIFWD